MSWTPYVGDPYSQVGETRAPVFDAEPKRPNRISRMAGMHCGQRLTTAMALAAPYQQFTPDQAYFRDSVATGRWAAQTGEPAHAPLTMIRRHDDGTCDAVRLEAHGKLWIDLGGRGARDVAARRP
jgi:hypothetical protein